MEKSLSGDPSQKESTPPRSSRLRVRKVPTTPQPIVATPSTSQAAVPPPDTTTTRPTETFMRDSYLQIIKDLMGRFSPAEKVSDLHSLMADELRKDEGATSGPIPFEVPTNPATQTEAPAMQRFIERMTSPIPIPLETPTDPSLPVKTPTTQPLEEPTLTPPREDSTEQFQNQEDEAEVEQGDEETAMKGTGVMRGPTRQRWWRQKTRGKEAMR